MCVRSGCKRCVADVPRCITLYPVLVRRTQLAWLPPQPSQQVFKAITDILTAYTEEHSRTKNATKDELSADLHCLLELVSCLIIKDGLDFGSESGPAVASSAVVHVVDVAMYGVRLVRASQPSVKMWDTANSSLCC